MVKAQEKPITCHICGATFSSKEELFRHAQLEHAGMPAGKADHISY
jgi:Zinc finger, C2H2 type